MVTDGLVHEHLTHFMLIYCYRGKSGPSIFPRLKIRTTTAFRTMWKIISCFHRASSFEYPTRVCPSRAVPKEATWLSNFVFENPLPQQVLPPVLVVQCHDSVEIRAPSAYYSMMHSSFCTQTSISPNQFILNATVFSLRMSLLTSA